MSGFLARAALAALLASASGGAALATTLEEAVASAYDTNPSLIAARAALRASDEQVSQARAGFRPQVAATASYGVTRTDAPTRRRNTADPFNLSIQATQSLYDGGVTHNAVEASIERVSAARARLSQTEQQIILRAITAYFDVVRDTEAVKLARNNVRVLNEQLRAARDRFQVGEVTRTDTSQAAARRAQSRANLAAAEGALEASRQTFRSVIGLEPENLSNLNRNLPNLPKTVQEALERALMHHPAVAAARYDERAARHAVRGQVGALLPNVALQGSYGYSDADVFSGKFDDSSSATVQLRAQIPLYQGGAGYSRVRQAQAQASQAQAAVSVAAREVQASIENAWSQFLVATASIRAGREEVRAARMAFEGVREEAVVGSRTTLDVLNAEQELLNARTRLVSAQRDEHVASYALLAATGELSAQELGVAVDQPYDPDVNYARNNDRWIGYPRTEDTVWEKLWRP